MFGISQETLSHRRGAVMLARLFETAGDRLPLPAMDSLRSATPAAIVFCGFMLFYESTEGPTVRVDDGDAEFRAEIPNQNG